MNRYTRINDLLGEHASKSFHKDITINRYNNPRKSKYKQQTVSDVIFDDLITNLITNIEPNNTTITETKDNIMYLDDEFSNDEFSSDESSDDGEIGEDEYKNEISDEIVFEPVTNIKNSKPYLFDIDELEHNLTDILIKHELLISEIDMIKLYLDLKKKYISGNVTKDELMNLDISDLLIMYIITPEYTLYTNKDYQQLVIKSNNYMKTITRYKKSIEILNNNNKIVDDEIVFS